MAKHRDFHLTCRNDIGPYRKGDHIEEAADVDALLKSEHKHHFVKVIADKPAPKAAPVILPANELTK